MKNTKFILYLILFYAILGALSAAAGRVLYDRIEHPHDKVAVTHISDR